MRTLCFCFRARNGTDVGEDPQLKNRYEIIDKENKFVIAKPMEEDAGSFSCSIPELKEEAIFDVVGMWLNHLVLRLGINSVFLFSECLLQTTVGQHRRC